MNRRSCIYQISKALYINVFWNICKAVEGLFVKTFGKEDIILTIRHAKYMESGRNCLALILRNGDETVVIA